jgi:hypothetical protein
MAEHTANYHQRRELSAGLLTEADISLLHYATAKVTKSIQTPAMAFGSAVHRILEDVPLFHSDYVLRPEGMDRRTKEGKIAYAEFESSVFGRTILERDDWQRVHAINQSFVDSRDSLIQLVRHSPGVNEEPIYWVDDGMECRCKPDRLIEVEGFYNEWLHEQWPSLFNPIANRICVDYKTVNEVNGFKWRLRSKRERGFGYGLAASHYLAGTKADAFLWIVLETSPPFTVTRYLMSPDTRTVYDLRRSELITQIAECESTGIYPGISPTNEETLL